MLFLYPLHKVPSSIETGISVSLVQPVSLSLAIHVYSHIRNVFKTSLFLYSELLCSSFLLWFDSVVLFEHLDLNEGPRHVTYTALWYLQLRLRR